MRIDIKDGIDNKISQRVFRIAELTQCVYHSSDCFSETSRTVADSNMQYNFIFVFKVSVSKLRIIQNYEKKLFTILYLSEPIG